MKRNFLSIIMILVLVFSLAACGGTSDTSSNDDSKSTEDTKSTGDSKSTTSSSDTSNSESVDTSEHVKITYMITGNKPTNGRNEEMFAELNKILTEKVNAELEIYWIEWTDYLTNYNLTLASNDGSIDLVGTATDWLDAWPNAKRGAFLPLTEDMLATYAPKTFEQVSDAHWDMCKLDGDIYLMPEDNFDQWINHGFIYRKDWADEFGFTDGLHSWADMGDYFAAVKENKPDVIPWDVAGSSGIATTIAGGYIASTSDFVLVDGLEVPIFGGSRSDNFTVQSPYMTDDNFIDFAKLMKEWSDAGYWREDCLNYSGDNREEFLAGQTSVDQHHTETWYGTDDVKLKERQGAAAGFFWFGEESGNLTKLSITHGATAIAAGSKNPERALMVYDILRNDEDAYRLFNYGIEGVQYVIDENGYFARPEGYDNDADSIQTDYWWGRNDDLQLKDAARDHASYEALVDEFNKVAIDYPYGQFIPKTDAIAPYLSNMANVYATYMPLIAFGKVDDPEATVQEFRDAMKAAGYDEVMAELQSQMDDFKAYLGK